MDVFVQKKYAHVPVIFTYFFPDRRVIIVAASTESKSIPQVIIIPQVLVISKVGVTVNPCLIRKRQICLKTQTKTDKNTSDNKTIKNITKNCSNRDEHGASRT